VYGKLAIETDESKRKAWIKDAQDTGINRQYQINRISAKSGEFFFGLLARVLGDFPFFFLNDDQIFATYSIGNFIMERS